MVWILTKITFFGRMTTWNVKHFKATLLQSSFTAKKLWLAVSRSPHKGDGLRVVTAITDEAYLLRISISRVNPREPLTIQMDESIYLYGFIFAKFLQHPFRHLRMVVEGRPGSLRAFTQ